ncbi:MAG: IPTL-CTERM sorting domain-containing protein [Candidatus Dadabacteria bacterium]|nr:IPTL-CTERM sorting domain-containing protein [Candidatus Dadabacteria bacterium]
MGNAINTRKCPELKITSYDSVLEFLAGDVEFEIAVGVNSPLSSVFAGTCSPNPDCTTDANGQVSWTYAGSDGGTDTIIAFFDDNGLFTSSNAVEKQWTHTANIPTLSEWGLIAMVALLGVVGFIAYRRRQVTA